MPGLNQLKQFTSDIVNVGDEVKIRSARGEKPVQVKLPKGISEADDSDDFLDGMPGISEEELAQEELGPTEDQYDLSELTGGGSEKTSKTSEPSVVIPDVSDLLSPGEIEISDDDLSEFETPAEPEPEPEPEPTPIEDLDLDALLQPSQTEEVPESEPAPELEKSADDGLGNDFDVSSLLNDDTEPVEADGPSGEVPSEDFNDKLDSMAASSVEGMGELPDFDINEAASDFSSGDSGIDMGAMLPDEMKEEPGFDVSDAGTSSDESGLSDDIPVPEMQDSDSSLVPDVSGSEFDLPPLDEGENSSDTSLSDFDLPSLDDNAFSAGAEVPDASSVETPSEVNASIPDSIDQNSESSVSSIIEDNSDTLKDMELPSFDSTDSDTGLEDIGSMPGGDDTSGDMPDIGNLDDIPGLDLGEEGSAEEPVEQFDTSGMDNMDFTETDSSSDFELGDVSGSGGDEEFSIPGFSDTVTANLNKKQEEESAAAETEDKEAASKPKNTFTDAEYRHFLANLEQYPLNVRIALEDFVVKNEFTDDAVFEVLEKVLRKAPARQVAADLEKKLDIPLDVPRDFERRSVDEYEAYKKTIEYQLKNRIIPFGILGTLAVILFFCIYTLSNAFIYKPLRARAYYKEGYAFIEKNQYPQSEDSFNKAIGYQSVKKWFFRYAEGYREHKQYERSRVMYDRILKQFSHSKAAGLAWADMEASDLYNYPEAERILKREVLDYYINDPDGILKLGDLYLDWATDKDPSKYSDAKTQYDLLVELYGANKKLAPKYLSRQMRYYIRTDNLAQVLQYKQSYFPDNKNLDGSDLVELSGYLLDKRYGDLPPSEENLRPRIEGLRDMLESALEAGADNPLALYNMGRYFVNTNNGTLGTSHFKRAIEVFKNMKYRNRRDTYKYIDTYRLLGEEYSREREYNLAEKTFGEGIDIFEKENESSGFSGTEEIGKLYADMGDLDYFVSGDMASARRRYTKAVENKNDTPSIRYRIGYIQYVDKNYAEALGSFITCTEGQPSDTHALLALANTLSLRDDNYPAQGCYEKLIALLEKEIQLHGILFPQVRADQYDIVDTYMKASNNLGVTLSRLADMTGNSKLNAAAIVQLQESVRAWDALTRNQTTMLRLPGSNLASENTKYITEPYAEYEPEIYTAIPKIMNGEEGLD